ncbi:type II toxin-antitoxin system RelB/DinJ family antitoxin [Adlercreutzia caecimuris]|jgi:addiction module RelB/DinJ family antitoxin|uniref:type II toxin-antitoxin system RelB/DinJ family antitoxin n=1 Tax=Adlercreutzia caecimuris TaxID=671266 RepID=UPI001364C106|nr:type II toxin-antitoxin system RelB/DinJ family antitoxin [Adlercreutzia caecimuris]NBJ66690.1 RelB/DinJ family addiction module antitoxin [Adlercreutzia caecimuris]
MATADAMVTARMSPEKKEMGNRILEDLGTNASQVINQLYDLVIEKRALPFPEAKPQPRTFSPQEIAEAKAWVQSLKVLPLDNHFATMTDDEIRRERLASRGHFDGREAQ